MNSEDVPIDSFYTEKNDMAHWFPKLQEADVITPVTYEVNIETDDDEIPHWNTNEAIETVTALGGEAFIRSGYASARIATEQGSKIYSVNEEEVENTVYELLIQQRMMEMPLGESLWFRELLDCNFCAYSTEQLNPEVRVFIRDGEIVCYHPRLEGFENHPSHREMAEDSIESGWDNDYLEYPIKDQAEAVTDVFDDGCWSVDFIMTVDGDWYCTDMAVDALYDRGERGSGEGLSTISEHPGDCEHDWENKIDEEYLYEEPDNEETVDDLLDDIEELSELE